MDASCIQSTVDNLYMHSFSFYLFAFDCLCRMELIVVRVPTHFYALTYPFFGAAMFHRVACPH